MLEDIAIFTESIVISEEHVFTLKNATIDANAGGDHHYLPMGGACQT